MPPLVRDPAALAGRWEALDEEGGVVGIQVLLTTTVPGNTLRVQGVPQELAQIEVGVYQRRVGEAEPPSSNYFTSDPKGGALWDGQHLQIDLPYRWKDTPVFHIQLTWHPKSSTWTGLFQRGGFRNTEMVLRRLRLASARAIVSTWCGGSSAFGTKLVSPSSWMAR